MLAVGIRQTLALALHLRGNGGDHDQLVVPGVDTAGVGGAGAGRRAADALLAAPGHDTIRKQVADLKDIGLVNPSHGYCHWVHLHQK